MRLREQAPSFHYRERYKQQRGNGVAQQAMVNAGGHPAIGLKRKFIFRGKRFLDRGEVETLSYPVT
jgi:hypothetical protein